MLRTPLLTLFYTPLALAPVFPLQMPYFLLRAMGQYLSSLFPSLLELFAQSSAYLFAQDLEG